MTGGRVFAYGLTVRLEASQRLTVDQMDRVSDLLQDIVADALGSTSYGIELERLIGKVHGAGVYFGGVVADGSRSAP